ncbi:MAG TPA: tetratricopeptide repeat protein [Actinoplanes sp.]|nr:tetratricopeptide repeat protein [Actinoplanes sp.]
MTELAASPGMNLNLTASHDPAGSSFADPSDAGVAQAAALFEDMQPDKAAEMLAPVLASRPDSAAGWILMARVRLALDQVPQALEAASRAVELAPEDPRPPAIASRALTLSGRHDEALSMAYRAVIVEPKNPLWHDRVAWALMAADRQLGDAEQAARTAVGLDPNEAHFYFTHGVALAALGHVDQARQALMTSLRLEPENPVAKHRLDVLNGAAAPVPVRKKRGWRLFGRKDEDKPVRPEEFRP